MLMLTAPFWFFIGPSLNLKAPLDVSGTACSEVGSDMPCAERPIRFWYCVLYNWLVWGSGLTVGI